MSTSIDFGQKQPQVKFRTVDQLTGKAVPTPPRKSFNADQPERFLWENLRKRPRSMSHHLSSTKVPSRELLLWRARFWRGLQSFAQTFHDLAPPKPPKPSFRRKIPTDTIPVELYFYCPPDYETRIAEGHRYPVVVNFHGGGFCLGHATDDRYWARIVLEKTEHVLVSVNYRRAPEHPFPIPVDDGVNALLYLAKNAEMLGLDTRHTALSGFSAGANLCFAVPLRLKYYTFSSKPSKTSMVDPDGDHSSDSDKEDTTSLYDPSNEYTATPTIISRPPLHKMSSTFTPHPTPLTLPSNLRLTSIHAFYPLLDWTQSRSAKKRDSVNPHAVLPAHFTDLFDFSYLPPPDESGQHCSSYASPGLAPDKYLRRALPSQISITLCEWDMLLQEGQRFVSRLEKIPGKTVRSAVVPGVPHGWDKSPNPWRDQKNIDRIYGEMCEGLPARSAAQGRSSTTVAPTLAMPKRRTAGGEAEAATQLDTVRE